MTSASKKTIQPATAPSTGKLVRATQPTVQPAAPPCTQLWIDRQQTQADQSANQPAILPRHTPVAKYTPEPVTIESYNPFPSKSEVLNVLVETTLRGWMARHLTVKQLLQMQTKGAKGIGDLASQDKANVLYKSYPETTSIASKTLAVPNAINSKKAKTLVVHAAAAYHAVDPVLIEAVVLRQRRELRTERQLSRAPFIKASREMVNRQNRDFEARLRQIYASGVFN